MELKEREGHTIFCDNEEFDLIRKALDYYTQNVAIKNSIDLKNNPDHPIVVEAIKYEEMCQALKIDGYEFT